MNNSEIHFVQLSDVHLFADPSQTLLGVPTDQSFDEVLKLIDNERQRNKLDFLLLTGDLSQDASKASYLRMADKVSRFNLPVYFLPGNHDDTAMLNQVYPTQQIQNQKQIICNNWQLVLLDSHIQGKVEGFIAKEELEFLEKCIRQYPNHHTIVSFHHQPVPVGCEWLDKLGVQNSTELWSMLANYPQINYILFGHVHQEFAGKHANVQMYSAPATCFQFKRNQAEFGLEKLCPGMRKVVLLPSGVLQTEVIRVAGYVGHFDEKAKGY